MSREDGKLQRMTCEEVVNILAGEEDWAMADWLLLYAHLHICTGNCEVLVNDHFQQHEVGEQLGLKRDEHTE